MAFIAASSEHQKRQRALARELRLSPWWKKILARGICHYCGKKFSAEQLTMDHVLPIVQGGSSTKSNVVAACKSCNAAKGHRSPLDMAFASLEQQKKDD